MLIKNKAFRDFLSRCITKYFSGLNRLIPKNPNQVLFYTNTGIKDNLKAVMDVMAAGEYDNYKLICSCNDTNGLPTSVKSISNPAGLFAFLRSGYVFYFNGKIPIKPSPKQTVVNLWHGIPLKKIGQMLYPDMDLDFATHYLAPSAYSGQLIQQVFGCAENKILINGLPRCDNLFLAPPTRNACILLGHSDCSYLIGWMPTFRNAEVSKICDSDLKKRSATGLPILHTTEDLSRCNELLKKHHALLWIKLHPNEIGLVSNKDFSNILIQTDAEFQILHTDFYRMLGSCNALITDYSSVYFDYLLLNRPILFAVEDIDSYTQNRGFTADDPITQMPGVILNNQEQFYDNISDILSGKPDIYEEQRNAVREKYCGQTDSQATKTLLKKINLKGA